VITTKPKKHKLAKTGVTSLLWDLQLIRNTTWLIVLASFFPTFSSSWNIRKTSHPQQLFNCNISVLDNGFTSLKWHTLCRTFATTNTVKTLQYFRINFFHPQVITTEPKKHKLAKTHITSIWLWLQYFNYCFHNPPTGTQLFLKTTCNQEILLFH
jgi:hypothetical protein